MVKIGQFSFWMTPLIHIWTIESSRNTVIIHIVFETAFHTTCCVCVFKAISKRIWVEAVNAMFAQSGFIVISLYCAIYMAIRVVDFSSGDTKLERFLHKNQQSKRKLLNFEFCINGKPPKCSKIWLLKSIFYVKNHPNLSQFFFNEAY